MTKKTVISRLILVCVFAAAAAVIGAFVFVNTVPVAERMSGQVTPTPRITMAPDDDPTEAADSSSASDSSSSSGRESGGKSSQETTTPKPTSTPVPSPSEDPDEGSEADEQGKQSDGQSGETSHSEDTEKDDSGISELTVTDYMALQDSLMQIADESMKCMVNVTAISSEMDYFNQSVENKQSISGVIITKSDNAYYILTENSIIDNVERLQVTFNDDFIADALFQMSDPDTGLAVLKVDSSAVPDSTAEYITTANLGNSYTVKVGDSVIALGSPNGYPNSVEFGRITSDSKTISAVDCEYNLLATDIIGSADGTGVLVNLSGDVVGIIDQRFCAENSQIVLAVSISQLKSLIEKLTNGETRACIGIKGQEVTESVSSITGIPRGIIITSVEDDSPALYAGLTQFDVITAINDTKVLNMFEYKDVLYSYSPGDMVTIHAVRKGAEGYKEIEFTVQTGEI